MVTGQVGYNHRDAVLGFSLHNHFILLPNYFSCEALCLVSHLFLALATCLQTILQITLEFMLLDTLTFYWNF